MQRRPCSPSPSGPEPMPEPPPCADSWENTIGWHPDFGACSSGGTTSKNRGLRTSPEEGRQPSSLLSPLLSLGAGRFLEPGRRERPGVPTASCQAPRHPSQTGTLRAKALYPGRHPRGPDNRPVQWRRLALEIAQMLATLLARSEPWGRGLGLSVSTCKMGTIILSLRRC